MNKLTKVIGVKVNVKIVACLKNNDKTPGGHSVHAHTGGGQSDISGLEYYQK